MLKVERIDELGVRGHLVEYGAHVEAYARVQDMKRARSVRSLNQITRVGRLEIVEVTDIDADGHVDVSRNIVTAEERETFEKKFNKAKQVNGVLSYVANTFKMEDLGDVLDWPDHHTLHELCTQQFKDKGLADEVVEVLTKECEKKLSEDDTISDVRERVEIMCTGRDGILGIQAAIRAGLATHPSMRIYLERHPLFTVMCVTHDAEEGKRRCEDACKAIQTELEAHPGGMFDIRRGRNANVDRTEVYRYSDLQSLMA